MSEITTKLIKHFCQILSEWRLNKDHWSFGQLINFIFITYMQNTAKYDKVALVNDEVNSYVYMYIMIIT